MYYRPNLFNFTIKIKLAVVFSFRLCTIGPIHITPGQLDLHVITWPITVFLFLQFHYEHQIGLVFSSFGHKRCLYKKKCSNKGGDIIGTRCFYLNNLQMNMIIQWNL